MAKITYANKVNIVSQPVPNENKVTAGDMNEIKASVNQNVDDIALKAELNGNSLEVFEVANGTISTHAINKSQLDSAIAKFSNITIVNTIDALRTEPQPTDGDMVLLLGYYEAGDKPIVSYVWDSASTETDNGGNIIKITAITTGRWIGAFEYANVKDFGAKGDYDYDLGTGTDDAVAFQNAINSKPDRASNVIVPYGNYRIGSTLELGQSTSIMGVQTLFPVQVASPSNLNYISQTALFFTENTDGFTTLTASPVTYRSQGIQIKYLGVFGTGEADGKTALKLIDNTNSSATFTKIGLATIEGCYFWDWDTGVNGSGTDSFNFFKNHISNTRLGLIGGLSETTISNNVFYKNSEYSLTLTGASASVSQNEFEPTTTDGISILITGSAVKSPKIENNHFKKNKWAIEIDATTENLNCIISENSFIEATGDRYVFLDTTNGVKITNNTFDSTSINLVDGNFVRAENSSNISINDNLFTKTTGGLITKPVYISGCINYQLLNNEYVGFSTAELTPTILSSSKRGYKTQEGGSVLWNNISNSLNSSYTFDGVNDRVTFATPSNFFTYNGSVYIRFKTGTDITTQQFVVGGATPRFYLKIVNSRIDFVLGDNIENTLLTNLKINTEYAFLVSWTDGDNDGSGTITAFENGRSLTLSTNTYTGFTSMPANFGLGANGTSSYFGGVIYDFMFFLKVLSTDEKDLIFNYPYDTFDSSLSCEAKLTLRKTSATWFDFSGNGNNGTTVGTITLNQGDLIRLLQF